MHLRHNHNTCIQQVLVTVLHMQQHLPQSESQPHNRYVTGLFVKSNLLDKATSSRDSD